MGVQVTSSAAEVRSILDLACANRELLILETPYLRFESNFLRLDPDAVHVRVSMGAEDAQFGLRSGDLRLRFPHATRFLQGRTRLLGFGMVDGRRSLRLTVPAALEDEDQRRAYRVERVGRVEVSFSTPRFELRTGGLVNLSTTGARIHAPHLVLEAEFKPGDPMAVTIPLSEEIRINTPSLVRWVHGRHLGLEFVPALDEKLLTVLSRWVFQRREEDKDRLTGHGAPLAAVPHGAAGEMVLVTGQEDLEALLAGHLAGLPGLRRIRPTVTEVKDALLGHPALLLMHAPGLGLDDRKRLRALVDVVGGRVPVVLLGTGVEAAPLMELATELRAASAYVLGPKAGPFFGRLLQGILRRQAGGEGVMAPKEPG